MFLAQGHYPVSLVKFEPTTLRSRGMHPTTEPVCLLYYFHCEGWLVGFVALRPKSTAMVIAGRSVHLTTLFPGQA